MAAPNRRRPRTGEGLGVRVSPPNRYISEPNLTGEPVPIEITYGYSRDHRPDLKQFIVDLICSSDGDIPLYLRVASGNESDSAIFANPMFFTDSVFLKNPERIEALAMVMGLCLLVYSLGQRALREALAQAKKSIKNQVGKPTTTPTLRWVFQCFQSIHLLDFDGARENNLFN